MTQIGQKLFPTAVAAVTNSEYLQDTDTGKDRLLFVYREQH